MINLHDLVALREGITTEGFPSGNDIWLPQGLVGTVVEEYAGGEAFEVEFADEDGQAYAMLTIEAAKLLRL